MSATTSKYHPDYWLPAEPLSNWLRDRRRYEATRMGIVEGQERYRDGYFTYTELTLIADAVGISPSRVEKYLETELLDNTDMVQVEGYGGHPEWVEQPVVSYRTVDRMLTYHGGYSISDIYSPETIEKIDLRTSPHRPHCKRCGIEMHDPALLCGFCQGEDEERMAA